MNVGEIMAFGMRRAAFFYYDEYNTSVRAWQIIFNTECDLFMKKDRHTFYRFNYEGVNHFGDHIFDQIPTTSKGWCCIKNKVASRHRILFTKRGRELIATHLDKISGHRTQYVVDV